MATGKHLKIKSFGTDVLGVKLEGNPQKPEPIHFRVVLPFGNVDIVRTTDNDYWVHVICENQKHGMHIPGEPCGKFIDARIDIIGNHGTECDKGDFGNPDMYHLAVRIGPKQ